MLPQDCLSIILSFTSPEDALRSSLVSSAFRSASDSDTVWERFLPLDYHEIVSSSVSPLEFWSKKELFQCLCDSVLIDGGNKILKLEKTSGKKWYILSAKELSISWSSNPLYWSWIPMAQSRFSKVAVLRTTHWLEIQGKIRTQILTPNTTYGAYLITKISERSYGLDLMPSEMTLEVGSHVFCSKVFLQRRESEKHMGISKGIEGDNNQASVSEREDGWMEIELGDFFSGQNDEQVKMCMREVNGYHLKGGLIIEGIELRPKD